MALNRKKFETFNDVEYGFQSSSESESEDKKSHQTNIFTAKKTKTGEQSQKGLDDYLTKLFKRL